MIDLEIICWVEFFLIILLLVSGLFQKAKNKKIKAQYIQVMEHHYLKTIQQDEES